MELLAIIAAGLVLLVARVLCGMGSQTSRQMDAEEQRNGQATR